MDDRLPIDYNVHDGRIRALFTWSSGHRRGHNEGAIVIIRFRLIVAATATALALSTHCLRAEEPAQGSDADEIKTLRARLDQLEAQQKAADRQRQEAERKLDEKITSDQLSQDAAHRDQFISAEGFTAGYSDSRFAIQSADGNFVLRPWFHIQVREVTLDRQGFQGN